MTIPVFRPFAFVWLLAAVPSILLTLAVPATAVEQDSDTAGSKTFNPTAEVQTQLEDASRSLKELQKQLVLKKADVDIATRRSADLEKQLQEAKLKLAEDAKALEKATADEANQKRIVAEKTDALKQHQQIDQLLAVAGQARTELEKARQTESGLTAEHSEIVRQLAVQEQTSAQAAARLKSDQEELPKSREELAKNRTEFDAASKLVDTARLAVSDARNLIKEKITLLQGEQSSRLAATNSLNSIAKSIKSLQESVATVQAAAKNAGANPDDSTREIQNALTPVLSLQKKAAELVELTSTRIAEAQKGVETATSALTAAETAFREQQTKYAQLSRTHFTTQLKVAELQNADTRYGKQIADATAAKEKLSAKKAELTSQLAVATSNAEKQQSEYVSQQKAAEAAMEPLDRFVSFSNHIAPIFAKRCVACHNTRTASGRLNMDSFSALTRGGESGVTFEPHNADGSLLVTMVADGSMPKDADALTENEIALIRKWVKVGAPLDAGIVASAELFQIMPEISQPLPPKTYRLPIPVTATAFNSDGSILASSGYHEILLWKTEDGSLIRRITNVAERVYDLEFSADGSQLAVAAGTPGQLGEVKLFSTGDGQYLRTLVRTKDAVFAVTFSPDGQKIAAAGADRVICVVEVATGKTTLKVEDHADWVMDVSWSPDGSQLVSASRDKTSKVFDVASGRSVITFNGHGDAVYSAAFLADGKSVVSAGSDRQARVWNVGDAKELRKIGGFGSDIFRVVVTSDNHLLTASADRNAREHDLADGKEIRSFAGHKDWVYTLSYNAQKKVLATGSYDGEIRVWNSTDGSVATSFIAIPRTTDATVARNENRLNSGSSNSGNVNSTADQQTIAVSP